MTAGERVRLSPQEMMQGAWIGVLRQVKNVQVGRKAAYGAGVSNDWQLHIEGAIGELVVSKALGLYWSGALNFRADDLDGVQVRSSSRAGASLILHPDDPDDAAFVLVTGINGEYVLPGWQIAARVKRQEFWMDRGRNGRPAYFVPQSELRPLSELRRLSRGDAHGVSA